jgi:FixJ family two-component response regulator
MPDATPTVLVIDDDPDIRVSVGRLLRSTGLEAQLFASISDFLKSDPRDGPTCLVLDVRLPRQSGLDLQRELASANRDLPIVFITGHGDIPMSVQAMKGGAIEFLTKPFRDQSFSTPFSSASLAIVLGARMKRLWLASGNVSNR